ncbi:LacI family DNA-binding transcriptional regulator [Hirschia baltica]|uniref:Transcriptional regulator, LacI family n=1 Tax=Hirschia baltica (strain ATCC 49814 / DSM 5838 / IFAM 1418) TaxID=582402 RepID=C6XIE2_HIRBI|nr:LacI family DNA-binding transcriptional regulator [Hirschia baltica]ACT60749.1 transcriptional regulator, LacI family [Hirschia baltica ATCC 49814]
MNGLPPKMKDVAELAGVSIKTVSRVLNNEPHVKDELRDKVKNAIEALGYVPSANARSLRSNRGYKIHYIMHNNRSNYVNSIQAGTIQTCQDHGYQLVVSMLKNIDAMSDDEIVQRLERLPTHGAPDGAVLVSPLSNHPKVNDILKGMKIPIARIGPNDIEDDEYDVKINEREAAQEITEYLIKLGHHRIGFIRGKEDQNATLERYNGYVDALKAHKLEIDPTLTQPGNFEFESGFTAGKHLLTLSNSPSAIFASNDDMAAGVLSAAHQLGVSVPDQLSVVGFDDSELASKIWPTLTTIRQPLLELGSVATELLIAKSQNTKDVSTKNFLPHKLIIRNSTGPAPA